LYRVLRRRSTNFTGSFKKSWSSEFFKPESKTYVLQQIEELRKRGAEESFWRTEFPLIIRQEDVRLSPVFDTTYCTANGCDWILGKSGVAQAVPVPCEIGAVINYTHSPSG
jgi:hypothetical protein